MRPSAGQTQGNTGALVRRELLHRRLQLHVFRQADALWPHLVLRIRPVLFAPRAPSGRAALLRCQPPSRADQPAFERGRFAQLMQSLPGTNQRVLRDIVCQRMIAANPAEKTPQGLTVSLGELREGGI